MPLAVAVGLAAAGLVAAPLAAVPLAARSAAAAEPICVAVVVDYRELANGPHTYCAKVPPGSTGADVLYARARALGRTPPSFDTSGFLCTIDGLPASGDCETNRNAARYWAYHYRTAGGDWQYSNKGPVDTGMGKGRRPKDGESEGWVWIEGDATGSRQPPDVAYAKVCPPEPKPAATTRPPAPPPAGAPGPGAGTGAPPAAPGTSRSAAPASGDRPASPAATGVLGTTAPAAPGTTPAASSSAPASPPPSASLPPITVADGSDKTRGVSTGTLAGAGLVVALGAAAVLRWRRGPR